MTSNLDSFLKSNMTYVIEIWKDAYLSVLEKYSYFCASVYIFCLPSIILQEYAEKQDKHTFCIHFRISECSILDIPKLVLILALSFYYIE